MGRTDLQKIKGEKKEKKSREQKRKVAARTAVRTSTLARTRHHGCFRFATPLLLLGQSPIEPETSTYNR